MTAVGDIINRGQPIPTDVLRFEDCDGDEWVRATADAWSCLDTDGNDTDALSGPENIACWMPLRVLAVSA